MKKEVKVGDTIFIGFTMLKCVVVDYPRCRGCYLREFDDCFKVIESCSGCERDDKKHVIFEEVCMTYCKDKTGVVLEDGSIVKLWIEDTVEKNGGYSCYMYVTCVPQKGFVLWGSRMTLEDAEPLEHWKDELEKNSEVVGNINKQEDRDKFFKPYKKSSYIDLP